MSGKIIVPLTVAVCCAGLAAGGYFWAKRSGLIVKYPEPAYLSEEEAAVRPVYGKLNSTEQANYEALYHGAARHEEKILLPYEITAEDYTKLYCLLEKQEGKLFYLSSSYYTSAKMHSADMVYRDEAKKCSEMNAELDEVTAEALSGLPEGDDYEKALYIHDFIAERCEYMIGEDGDLCATAYGCLIEGKANCEGYAKAFDMLAGESGLKSVVVTGLTDKDEDHAWNQVMINGSWYDLDLTWDDIQSQGDIRYVYFLCNDEIFGRTHFADTKYFQPFSCTDSRENYFVKNGLYVETLENAEEILRRRFGSGQLEATMRFSDSEVYEEFKKLFIDTSYLFDIAVQEGVKYTEKFTLDMTENKPENCIYIRLSSDFSG